MSRHVTKRHRRPLDHLFHDETMNITPTLTRIIFGLGLVKSLFFIFYICHDRIQSKSHPLHFAYSSWNYRLWPAVPTHRLSLIKTLPNHLLSLICSEKLIHRGMLTHHCTTHLKNICLQLIVPHPVLLLASFQNLLFLQLARGCSVASVQ